MLKAKGARDASAPQCALIEELSMVVAAVPRCGLLEVLVP